MSDSNANTNLANGPATVVPKPSTGVLDKLQQLITEPAHFILRLYFSVLLLVYFWFVKVFTRLLQPFEPLFEQMHKIPPGDATSEGIRKQISQLLSTILVFVSPLVSKVIGVVTHPLGWARDKLVEYVQQGERQAPKQTNPKAS